ncbi:phage minor tail protein L [Xenorhabdus thuongxuanensis]|uniref:Phage minor tail protein L n=1 Tax=Xenorhabdus thuongxuanensis TaxID=1873484 RepID=A0A1Q5TIW9_9GAMM|nr:hypothetical protein [Xenorhabdus thuongxuanensis]OKP00173.1 phage minor tail protein L [Xenorhabdus thuongxuanensis]
MLDMNLANQSVVVTMSSREIAELTGKNKSDIQIPTRQIHNLCTWCMRGLYRKSPCNYTGTQYFYEDGNPTDDPSRDVCGGLMNDCKDRYGEDALRIRYRYCATIARNAI